MADIDGAMRVVLFPNDDAEFRQQVNDAVSHLKADGADGHHDGEGGMIRVLETLLPLYPRLEIRQQNGLASFDADPHTWYVFRDGSSRAS